MTPYGLYIKFTHTSVVVILSEQHILYNDDFIHTDKGLSFYHKYMQRDTRKHYLR